MKKINMKSHMYLDYLVVALFVIGPTVLGLGDLAVKISLALALVHSTVTILTFTPSFSIFSSKVHGVIEILVAPSLLSVPWILGFSNHTPSLMFFTVMGISTFAAWAITDYNTVSVQKRTSMLKNVR